MFDTFKALWINYEQKSSSPFFSYLNKEIDLWHFGSDYQSLYHCLFHLGKQSFPDSRIKSCWHSIAVE